VGQIQKTHAFLSLYKELCQHGLKPLVVKGLVCRALYPKPDLRHSSDEDLLVREDALPAVLEFFRQKGLTIENEDDEQVITCLDKQTGVYLELHRTLFSSSSQAYGALNRHFEEAFADAYSAQDDELEATADATAGVELSKEDERFCRKLERIVSTRLRNPNLNIDIIAAQFGIGRTNFYRKVRELMGVSPNDYLRKCRMERAAELLRGTELPVSDVCAQVGIPDAQYFSRVFKAYFGVTPSAYRENNNQ
jgi:AraC-like DNA-binding protein